MTTTTLPTIDEVRSICESKRYRVTGITQFYYHFTVYVENKRRMSPKAINLAFKGTPCEFVRTERKEHGRSAIVLKWKG
jgi:hypothetical protein